MGGTAETGKQGLGLVHGRGLFCDVASEGVARLAHFEVSEHAPRRLCLRPYGILGGKNVHTARLWACHRVLMQVLMDCDGSGCVWLVCGSGGWASCSACSRSRGPVPVQSEHDEHQCAQVLPHVEVLDMPGQQGGGQAKRHMQGGEEGEGQGQKGEVTVRWHDLSCATSAEICSWSSCRRFSWCLQGRTIVVES